MCDNQDALIKSVQNLGDRLAIRPRIGATYLISDTQGFVLDYRNRLHVYMFATVALTLNLQDIGTFAVAANTWTDISFREHIRLFTSGQATPVPVYIVCADETIAAYSGGASIVNLHNADNQPVPAGNAQLVDNLAVLLNVIGKTDRQREVGADGAPSDGITTTAANLAQTQSSTATGAITAGQTTNATITPSTMTSGMVPNQEVDIDFGTANVETGFIVSTTASTITVQPANGSPSAPSWLFSHTGTYKIQVKAYNVARDAKGENSGADGTGTSLALEYEWNSGGPPLATGVPSLDQYDRETLILGQGTDSQAVTSTVAGNTSITLTSAKATLTPGAPIRLTGSGTSETVYVDQSYVPGSNTVIPLKHPVVNSGQTLAAWQKYTADGPLTSLIPLYGEGMEGILLGDPKSPGFGLMMHGNYDNITVQTLAAQGAGTVNGATQVNPNARGVMVCINISSVTGSLTVAIQNVDPVSGVATAILTSAALAAGGQTFLFVYPGITAATNTAASAILTRSWRVSSTIVTGPVTATISAALEI